MVSAFLKSLGDLGDRRILRVFVQSLALTLAVFLALGFGAWWGISVALAGRDAAMSVMLAVAVMVLALWLLFRAVAIAVIGLFGDTVVAAVEARHYADALAGARPVPFPRALAMGLASAGWVILVNLLALPIYLVLLVTGVGTVAAFFAVNGWALGRDLGDMVAARHLDAAPMRDWRRATRAQRFLLGLAITALFVVPLLGLVAPILGAAMATHLFHGARR